MNDKEPTKIQHRSTGNGQRHKDRELNEAHHALMEWAEWHIRHVERSPLGYPSSSVEGKVMRGWLDADMNPFRGSIVPNVGMNAYIRAVDLAVRDMSPLLSAVVWLRYQITNPEPHDGRKRHEQSDSECARRLGVSRPHWNNLRDRVWATVAAYRKMLRRVA